AGLAMLGFAATSSLPLAIVVLAVLGATQSLAMIATQTTLNLAVGNEYRGRVNSIYITTWNFGPVVAVGTGWAADNFGAPLTVGASGALTALFMALAALWLVEVRRFTDARAADESLSHRGGRG